MVALNDTKVSKTAEKTELFDQKSLYLGNDRR